MNKSRRLDTTSLVALAFYYSQNKTNFYKTLFLCTQSTVALPIPSTSLPNNQICKKKVQKHNVAPSFLPPLVILPVTPTHISRWVLLLWKSCIAELIFSSCPQLSPQRERENSFSGRRQAERVWIYDDLTHTFFGVTGNS